MLNKIILDINLISSIDLISNLGYKSDNGDLLKWAEIITLWNYLGKVVCMSNN